MNKARYLLVLAACAVPSFATMMEGATFIYGGSSSKLYSTDQSTVLKSWSGAGYAAFFSDSGTVFYETSSGAGSASGCQSAAGYGSIVEARWDGTVIRTITTAQLGGGSLHHAFNITKNGTILAIAIENYNGACGERIVEYNPNTSKIVWSWHTNDHKGSNNAAKMTAGSQANDPFHMNGLDLDPTRNVVIFSAHNTYEVYMIDHSIDSTTAKTSTGGNYGKGGDILWRWGKPSNYGISSGTPFIETAVHSARFVPVGTTGAGNVLLYANKSPQYSSYATGFEIKPVESGYSFSTKSTGEFDYTILFAGSATAGTTNLGGMDKLPNGNWLVTYTGLSKAAEYNAGTVTQTIGSAVKTWSASSSNGIRRYPLCYAGLLAAAKTDAAVATLTSSCSATATQSIVAKPVVSVLMTKGNLALSGLSNTSKVRIMDVNGQLKFQGLAKSGNLQIATNDWANGAYFVQVNGNNQNWTRNISILH